MSLENLNKEDLTNILADKQIVHDTLVKKAIASTQFAFSNDELYGLSNARCRLCIGERFEVKDESNPVGKVLMHRGQPISMSQGGNEMACRTCKHVRYQLQEQGIRDVYI